MSHSSGCFLLNADKVHSEGRETLALFGIENKKLLRKKKTQKKHFSDSQVEGPDRSGTFGHTQSGVPMLIETFFILRFYKENSRESLERTSSQGNQISWEDLIFTKILPLPRGLCWKGTMSEEERALEFDCRESLLFLRV
jgi:hypothetical protein